MTNIIQCPKCERWLINEEFPLHMCEKKIVDIRYKWFVKTQLDGYGEVLIIEGNDGILYRITDEKLQQQKSKTSDADDTEPYKWFCIVCVGYLPVNNRRITVRHSYYKF